MTNLHILRSLRHRNFRIYYLGQLVSLNGTWMQSVAQSWLVYRLTESGFLLGLAGTLTLLPSLVLGIYGGWLADRFERRRLLIIVQTLALLQALILGVLTVGGWVEPWHILILALALGLVQAVETPVRQSFIAQLVERDDLANAIALNSSMFHLARFVGPAIAGLLVAWVGEGPVFLLNAVTFVAVLLSLLALHLPASKATVDQGSISGIWSGLHYAREHSLIRTTLAMVATVSLLGGSTAVLMPIFIANVYERGPEGLGLFMGMLGAGSLVGALRLAQLRDLQRLERRVAWAGGAVGLALMAFAFNDLFTPALGILFVIGLAATTVFASSNTLIQLAVPDHLRGRVMALYTVCLHGMVSLGQVMIGSLADVVGAPMAAGFCGVGLFCLALLLGMALYKIKQV